MTEPDKTEDRLSESFSEQRFKTELTNLLQHARNNGIDIGKERVLNLDLKDYPPLSIKISRTAGVNELSRQSEQKDSPPPTVLLADDNDELRESYKYWLKEKCDWNIQEAMDGIEALAKLDHTVDILVLDRNLPKLSGSKLLNRLNETSFTGQVLVISAYSPDQHLSEDDVTGYLIKPVHRVDLITSLEEML